MNKLVIIGNGFDLAHGMKTSYKDFLLWEINEAFRTYKDHKIIKSPLFTIESEDYIYNHKNPSEPFIFKSIDEFKAFLRENVIEKKMMKVDYTYQFIKDLFGMVKNNWVDIEREYYKKLLFVNQLRTSNNEIWKKILIELNNALDLIKNELEKYLSTISTKQLIEDLPSEIMSIFTSCLINNHMKDFGENIYFLNFNYTNTVVNYTAPFLLNKSEVNYIHGKLNKKDNPIIFGYGDETDKNYETIEDLNENEFTRHFKSFSYLTTSNYQDLFEYLGKDKFEVHIMGHSCGLSDRVLFNHIFEHDNFDRVQLYYYQYGEKDYENDYFQKTQELSRYFKLNSKHKMRTRVVPFSKSKPLTTYKP